MPGGRQGRNCCSRKEGTLNTTFDCVPHCASHRRILQDHQELFQECYQTCSSYTSQLYSDAHVVINLLMSVSRIGMSCIWWTQIATQAKHIFQHSLYRRKICHQMWIHFLVHATVRQKINEQTFKIIDILHLPQVPEKIKQHTIIASKYHMVTMISSYYSWNGEEHNKFRDRQYDQNTQVYVPSHQKNRSQTLYWVRLRSARMAECANMSNTNT